MKRPVAFVVETGSLAGGVRVIGELANRLAERGWEVSIWSVNPVETLSAWFRLDSRVVWHNFMRTATVADYEPLAAVLRKQPAAKIATFWKTALIAPEYAAEGEGYYLVQDVETSYSTMPLLSAQVLATYQLGLRQFTTSRWVEAQLPGTAYIGIGLGNGLRPPKPKHSRADFALACARLQALKGYATLAEVTRYLFQMGIPTVTYGLDKKVPMLTKVEHHPRPNDDGIRRLLQTGRVFLSTSQHEGFNLTALEAMACGLPVVTTDSDGNREYIEHEANCLVAGSAPDLALAVYRLFTDRDLWQKLAANGPAVAGRYRWGPVLDRLEAVLLE